MKSALDCLVFNEYTLRCDNCGKIREVLNSKDEKSAFMEGWDFSPYFSIGQLATCPDCSTAELLFKNTTFEV